MAGQGHCLVGAELAKSLAFLLFIPALPSDLSAASFSSPEPGRAGGLRKQIFKVLPPVNKCYFQTCGRPLVFGQS